MKTSLKIIALVIAAGFPVAALAEFAGLSFPVSLSPETVLGVFVTALVGLTLVSDYSRKARNLAVATAPVIVPSANAFVMPRAAKSECLAA